MGGNWERISAMMLLLIYCEKLKKQKRLEIGKKFLFNNGLKIDFREIK